MGKYFLALSFALQPVSYSLQSRQRPHPDSSNLDGCTLRQNWSAHLYDIYIYTIRALHTLFRALHIGPGVKGGHPGPKGEHHNFIIIKMGGHTHTDTQTDTQTDGLIPRLIPPRLIPRLMPRLMD